MLCSCADVDDYTLLREVSDVRALRAGDHCVVGVNLLHTLWRWSDVLCSLFTSYGLVPFFHWLSIAPADLLAALAPGVWRTFLLYGAGYAYFSSLTPAPITPARALGGSHVAWHVLVVAGLREWAEVCRQMLAQEAVGCDAWR